MSTTSEKTADAGAVVSLMTVLLSHIHQINEVLQAFALLVAILSGTLAICQHVWHWIKERKL